MTKYLTASELKIGHVYQISKDTSLFVISTPQYESYWNRNNFIIRAGDEFLILSEAFPTNSTDREDLSFLHVIGVNKEFAGWAIVTTDFGQFTEVKEDGNIVSQ